MANGTNIPSLDGGVGYDNLTAGKEGFFAF